MLIHFTRDIQEEYAFILNLIYYSVLTLSTIFITYPFWSEKYRSEEFISILWNITVFYNLAFSSSLLVVIGQFNQMQITILMASLITLASSNALANYYINDYRWSGS